MASLSSDHPSVGIEVDARLVAIFREVFNRPDMIVTRPMTPDAVTEWDSMRTMAVLMAVEERFDITLRAAQVRALRSVGDIERLLPRRDRDGAQVA